MAGNETSSTSNEDFLGFIRLQGSCAIRSPIRIFPSHGSLIDPLEYDSAELEMFVELATEICAKHYLSSWKQRILQAS